MSNKLKSAEDFVKDVHNLCDCAECKYKEFSREDLLEVFKAIQLNAYKAGMSEAVEIASKWLDSCKRVGATPSLPFKMLHEELIEARDRKESL